MKRPALGLIAILGLVSLACGLLDEEAATVTYEEAFPLGWTVDAEAACPEFEDEDFDCDDDPQPAEEDIELDPVELGDDIDLVEATGQDELEDIGPRLRTLTITSIDYEIDDNDLTFDIPELDIYVAPVGVEETDHDDAVHLTTIPQTSAGQDVTPAESAVVEDQEAASEVFKQMEFTTLARTQPKVEEGQPFPPSGDADIGLTINIKIEANPTDEM